MRSSDMGLVLPSNRLRATVEDYYWQKGSVEQGMNNMSSKEFLYIFVLV